MRESDTNVIQLRKIVKKLYCEKIIILGIMRKFKFSEIENLTIKAEEIENCKDSILRTKLFELRNNLKK